MKRTKTFAAAVSSITALALLVGCTAPKDSTSSQADDTSSSAEESVERPDLSTALLTVDDLSGLTNEYGEFEEMQLGEMSSDAIIEGDPMCADYLDDTYGAESVAEARTAFRAEYEALAGDDPAYMFVLSTVKEYADYSEAATEFEALREVFASCKTFVYESNEAEVTREVRNFDEAYEELSLGDEALVLVMVESTWDINFTGEYGYVFTRVGKYVVMSGAFKSGLVTPIDFRLMSTVTEGSVDRVNEYIAAN